MNKFSNFTNTKSAFMSQYNIFRYKEIINLFKTNNNFVIRGNGTSYNDLSLNNNGNVILTKNLNKILSFDYKKKIIKCQSGLIIKELLQIILKRNLFLYSTPGTYRASIGGLIATDAHGKNVKKSFFSDSLISIKILTPNNKIIECSRNRNKDLFFSTIGGFGLTGIILEAEFKLLSIPSLLIEKKTSKFKNIDEMLLIMDNFKHKYDYIYTIHNTSKFKLDQGYVIGGRFINSKHNILKFNNFFNFRIFKLPIINKLSVQIFNLILHATKIKKNSLKIVDIINFFYPLEKFRNWEGLYGKNGFFEFQVFVPKENFKFFFESLLNNKNLYKSFSFLSSTKFISKTEGYFSCKNELAYNFAIDLFNNKSLKENYKTLCKIAKKFDSQINIHKDILIQNNSFFISNKNLNNFKKNLNLRIINSDFSKRVSI